MWFIIYMDGKPSTIAQAPNAEALEQKIRENFLGKQVPEYKLMEIWDAPRDDVILVGIIGLLDSIGQAIQAQAMAAMQKGGRKH